MITYRFIGFIDYIDLFLIGWIFSILLAPVICLGGAWLSLKKGTKTALLTGMLLALCVMLWFALSSAIILLIKRTERPVLLSIIKEGILPGALAVILPILGCLIVCSGKYGWQSGLALGGVCALLILPLFASLWMLVALSKGKAAKPSCLSAG